jgi:hypothetical protein
MAVATKKRRRLVFGGSFTCNRNGLPHQFYAGDVLPEDVEAALSKAEIAIMLSNATLIDRDAPPPRRPEPAAPRTWSAVETLHEYGWPAAAVEGGDVARGPRGYSITVHDRTVREDDLGCLATVGRDTQVVVHRVDGLPVASLPLARLVELIAISQAGGRAR